MDLRQSICAVSGKSRILVILVLVFVLFLAIDVMFYFGLRQRNLANTNSSPIPAGSVESTDDPYMGGVNAKVVIVEFSDYQCPFCLQAFPIVQDIIQTYGNKIKFIYRDFPNPLSHPDAQKAAEAARCAGEQGKYWPMHDLIFTYQSDMSVTALKRYAQQLSLNEKTFNHCLDSGQMYQKVQEDFNAGYAAGVRGTPTFFINGRQFQRVIPREEFKSIIDQLLAIYQQS